MRIKIIILFIGIFISVSAQKKVQPESALIKKIVSAFNKMRKFDGMYEKAESDNSADSINKYNRILASILSSDSFDLLKDADLKEIARLTEIKICISPDKKLKIVSWRLFIYLPNQICSNIVWVRENKSRSISINADSEGDFDNQVQIDTIVDIENKGKVSYTLIGSNRCGNLCIQQIASIYAITDKGVVKCSKCFYDGKDSIDEVEFNYVLNDEIESEPSFRIERDELLCPIFNERKTQMIGTKKYKISTSMDLPIED